MCGCVLVCLSVCVCVYAPVYVVCMYVCVCLYVCAYVCAHTCNGTLVLFSSLKSDSPNHLQVSFSSSHHKGIGNRWAVGCFLKLVLWAGCVRFVTEGTISKEAL